MNSQRQRPLSPRSTRWFSLPAVVALSSAFACAQAAAPPTPNPSTHAPIVIDASAATPTPGPADYTYAPEDARSPSGQVLGLNARYLTLNGKPWLPVMGEFHYTRVPEAQWEPEILKMKSAGVNIISTYIIWIHQEEVEGQWDWQGRRNLRRFVQLCAKHGMYVVPRIGPWSHAEVRNGGFPDWLLTKTHNLRSNDPVFLHYVDLYYKQIGEQLKGLMWSEGGPVIAVQIENEYHGRGPGRGDAYILRLKQMAREDGMRVPFYTVTDWDGASIPKGAVLPVGGGYPDAPWDASLHVLPPSSVYDFHFRRRAVGDMGAIGGAQPPSSAPFTRATPYITAEMGGGMQITYHRRPIVSANDIAAMVPVALGSGVNLYGTYVFQGGENPDGKLTTLQESLATHYANDLPVKSYDFQAPLGEFGEERESYRKLKDWDYFMNDFGAALAPMQVHPPAVLPTGPRDFSAPRVSARTQGQNGFLFVNNYVREYDMPAHQGFQVEIKLPAGKQLLLPEQPIDLPSGSYFVWPFNEDLAGLHLRFATAQPLAKLGTADAPVFAFFAQPGIAPEFVIDDTPGLKLDGTAGVERHDGALWLHNLTPGPATQVRFTLASGKHVTLLLLTQQDAENAWKIASHGATDLLITPQQAYVNGSVATLEHLGATNFSAQLALADRSRLAPVDPHVKLVRTGDAYSATLATSTPTETPLKPRQIRPVGEVAPLPPGFAPSSKPRVVAAAPTDADWSHAALWTLPIPNQPPAVQGERQFLRIRYTGDVARVSAGGHLLTDNFFDGKSWLVGLNRFASEIDPTHEIQLAIYPLRKDPPIFFEPGSEPVIPGAQVDTLDSVDLVTQYSLQLRLTAPGPALRR